VGSRFNPFRSRSMMVSAQSSRHIIKVDFRVSLSCCFDALLWLWVLSPCRLPPVCVWGLQAVHFDPVHFLVCHERRLHQASSSAVCKYRWRRLVRGSPSSFVRASNHYWSYRLHQILLVRLLSSKCVGWCSIKMYRNCAKMSPCRTVL